MAITTKLARKVLSKKEQSHLNESGIKSIQSFSDHVKRMENEQKIAEQKHGDNIPFFLCRCPECHTIAKKLGLV